MTSKATKSAHGTELDPTTVTALTLQRMEMPGLSELSENSSIHSSSKQSDTSQSDTSTLRYDQEAYDLFRIRVEKLCQVLWPPPKSIRQSLLDSKAATRMRANKFFRLFVPSQDTLRIERLRGGDYNRIVGIRLPVSKSEVGRNRDLILRVPRRWGRGRTERVVAILSFLHHNSAISVPSVVAKDFSNDNPLESPYLIQDRLAGSDLGILWPDLNHSQRCTIAREVGRVLKSLLALESPVTGYIEAAFKSKGTVESHIVMPFDLRSADGDLFEEPEEHCLPITGTPRQNQTTLDLFKCQIGRWRAVDVARNAGMVDRTLGLWDEMLKIAEEMNTLGFFTAKLHCLCHVDLYPRNIMARILPQGSIEVTGVLDWDEAVIAPKFMSCEPPGWLWGFDPDDPVPNNLPTWPYERPGANDMPSTLEKQGLKQIFEEHVGPEYLGLAYGEQFRMSRTLFRVALFGLTSSENYDAADQIISDWARFRQSLTK
ncbi:hypothetical protein IMSHALPRED_004598 [Imshaugia aleurites]|uniref:Aminoglycoside phosphotransferase domain-containing protein n=1 Tax=Imshaugia aleurites TaxID=172621 RepID=A0A8H3FEF1_9LECA|nr:hypothetical protein IMSHALPRED_004598 [Imshaugia aleurites]